MPYVNPEARLAFLAHPRAASHSISRALQDQASFLCVPTHHGDRSVVERAYPESTDWTFFSVVRNDYDALVSWWYKRGKNDGHVFGPTWIEQLEHEIGNGRPQPYPILAKPGELWIYTDESDAILRCEQLDADLNELLIAHGLGPVTLPWDVKSARNGKPYQEYYDDVTRNWVAERYGEELRTWGYDWE